MLECFQFFIFSLLSKREDTGCGKSRWRMPALRELCITAGRPVRTTGPDEHGSRRQNPDFIVLPWMAVLLIVLATSLVYRVRSP